MALPAGTTSALRSRRWRPPLLVGAASGLLLSGLMPWFDVGVGRGVSGFRVAGLVLALGDLGGRWPPTWVGLAWFSVPVTGALTVLLVGCTGGERRLVLVWVPAVGALTVASGALVVSIRAGFDLARGPAVATLCAMTIVAASFAPGAHRRPPLSIDERAEHDVL